jgi:hypothetical protein
MLFDDDDVNDVDTLTDDDRAAYAAEARGETYEPESQPSPEVIEEKRELANQLAAERERFARLDERRIAAEEATAPSRQQEPQGPPSRLGARPDDYLDPIGADLWDVRRENEILAHRFEAQQRTAEQNEFTAWVERDAAQFRAQHVDYDQATAHVYQFRVNHWMRIGLTEQHARAIVDQEALATAKLARQNGKSPSAQFYALAKEVGYQPGATKGQSQSRPRLPTPVRGQPQRRARRVTAHDIDAMGESEFEAALRSNPRAVVKALEGLEFER